MRQEAGGGQYPDSTWNTVGMSVVVRFDCVFVFERSEVTLSNASGRARFPLDEPSTARIALAAPDGIRAQETRAAFSSGYGGYFMLEKKTAHELGLARFEIRGRAIVESAAGPTFEARRARVRFAATQIAVNDAFPALLLP